MGREARFGPGRRRAPRSAPFLVLRRPLQITCRLGVGLAGLWGLGWTRRTGTHSMGGSFLPREATVGTEKSPWGGERG